MISQFSSPPCCDGAKIVISISMLTLMSLNNDIIVMNRASLC